MSVREGRFSFTMNRAISAIEKLLPFKLPADAYKAARNASGFFLVEILSAFFVLALILSAVVPIWIHLQNEAKANLQQSLAIDVARNEVEHFFTGDEEAGSSPVQGSVREVSMNDEIFFVEWQQRPTDICAACVQWTVTVSWQTPAGKQEKIVLSVYGAEKHI